MRDFLDRIDTSGLLSPSLVILVDEVRRNVSAMVELARGPDRLRPHVKTHKMPEMIRLVESMGIRKHKCATIAEAEMVVDAGGLDVLLAYPAVGPNVDRLARLVDRSPPGSIRCVVDHPGPARRLSEAMRRIGRTIPTLVDLDVGMGRTGIDPGDPGFDLARLVDSLDGLDFDGLHAYDGHVRDREPEARRLAASAGIEATLALRGRLIGVGLPVPRVVLGGTPTFPIHAEVDAEGVECSPGTSVFHDGGYAGQFPDLPFRPAAFLLTRVVSRPRNGRVCLDLGHKAVAADPVGPRLALIGHTEARVVGQSEEHLVVEGDSLGGLEPGDPAWAIPTHICPTCALHAWAYAIDFAGEGEGEGRVGRWAVRARDRVLGV